ncbi:4-hydroxy-tetrahydrodipicolinate synthase [Aerolutibacter ruishenii]|uniref:4-hydroxy-tetrahydrodipicolinate synthase n=1 Tax=Aerolutibacter ruishenii TaxID=686800 RepID=A0A562LYA3_9GAMM|nr:4-hydroxy-tetrahydrodipicolinate synthase [Lysobacter ruishenii]TWI12533.1 4-hydroxy-tetrahydrodipicolinate synthase [Lysobacter ruishenii]
MRLSGSITALATPFGVTGELDLDAWQRLLAGQLEGGTQAIVVAGSTGEANALHDDEFDILLRTAVEAVAGRIPVLAGTGLSNTAKTIEQSRRAAALGADAALIVTPPYVRPTQAGMVAHYRAIADDGALPVVLYNVPGRTGSDLLPETVSELYQHPRIVGIKEARNDPGRMAALLAFRSEAFTVLSGDDSTACRAMLAGADGVVSVASNVLPRSFRRLCDLARARRVDDALAWDARLAPTYDFFGIEPNPIPVKALLAMDGIGHGLRLPLTELSSTHRDTAIRIAGIVRDLESACRDSVTA